MASSYQAGALPAIILAAAHGSKTLPAQKSGREEGELSAADGTPCTKRDEEGVP
jgi:hypothetical protein